MTDRELRCVHCGKPRGDHKANGANCPGGKKNQTHGYQWYHETYHYTPPQTHGIASAPEGAPK